MLRVLVPLTLLCACANAPENTPLRSAADIRWVRTFASAGDDWVNEIIALRSGDYLAAGYLNRADGSDWRAVAVELSAEGAVRRQTEYGEGGGIDAFFSAAEEADSAIAYAGFTTRIGAGGIDAWFARTDASGALIEERTFGEAAYDRVTDLAPVPGGGWILAGHSVAPGTEHRRVMILRVDAQGREVWRRIYTERESSGALYVECAPDGGYIIAGGASQGGDGDVLIMKLDAGGSEIWRRVVGAEGSADVNHGLVVRPDGRIVAVGYTASWGAQEYDMFALTLSADGELLERSVFGGARDDRAINAKLDRDGRVWIVGYTRSSGAGDWDVIVSALDDAGRFEPGAAILAGAADDNGAAILPLPGGDLLVGGYSRSFSAAGEDAFVLRLERPDLRRADRRFTPR